MNYWVKHGLTHNNPKMIVVHCISEFFEVDGRIIGASEFLDKIGLSAHVLITPYGEQIRMRNDNQGAYHAKGFNTDSLGIEFLVPGISRDYGKFLEDIRKPYLTFDAYHAGVAQVSEWARKYNIGRDNIKQHSKIDPERKKDPGAGFPWVQFMNDVL